jgi:ELWxxDGT repeat protein
MKPKQLLLLAVMLMLTALTGIAQNTTYKQHSVKDIIPFGKQLPAPDLSKYPGKKSLPAVARPDANNASLQSINSLNANEIKKNPEYFRQQLLKSRALLSESFHRSGAPAIDESNISSHNSDFHLTKDINALAESNPSDNKDEYPFAAPYAILNHVMYFAADDGIHGNELWRSDGTTEGTYMVKDIEPGEASSLLTYSNYITAVNGKLYFSATTSAYGPQPWVSDGTESGTQLLMGVKPGASRDFVQVGNSVYFVANGSLNFYDALWKTDGTTAGTVLIKDIGASGHNYYIVGPTASNGLLFFTMYDFTFGFELWRSDGTDAGTYLLNDIATFPAQLTNYNNKLYFSADDGSGRKLWVSDGTDAGTMYAPNNHDILIDDDYFGITFAIKNNVLYIPATSPSTGSGLYKYDASDAAGLVLVKDLTPGTDPDFIAPSEMKIVNNELYFKVTNYNGGLHDELWSSKGSKATTQLVKTFLPGESFSSLYNGNGTLYFGKYDKVYGGELWKSDGSDAGTILVSDIFKGVTSSGPGYLTAFKGKLFFSAADEKKGNELFMTDCTDNTTALVKDINTVSTSGSYPAYLTALGQDVVFQADERVHGWELYKSDGTSQGTGLLNDIGPGELGSYPYAFSTKKNAVYFIAASGSTTYSIYKTNGTKPGLQKITPDYDFFQYNLIGFQVADNGLVFYDVFNYNTYLFELWRSDGTAAGTFLLSSALYYYNYLNIVGNTAFFVAGDVMHGYELWKSDGSLAGTGIVKDINPVGDAAPGGMFAYNNEVYFGAYDGTSDHYSFWKSDGTEAGTIKLKNIDPWWGYDAASTGIFFCISNNILYFSAINYSDLQGTKLWKTNGTPAGTQPVKDINPTNGDVIEGPVGLTDVNGTLFFTADDGVHGTELWKSDGTRNGTQLVKDITKGADGTSFSYYSPFPILASFAGKLFFNANSRLWSSDGTAHGTAQVDGISNVEINEIRPAGNQLFLSGYTYKYGWELYAGKAESEKFAAVTDESTAKTSGTFNALLYPNPAASKASLQITGNVRNVYISITDMSGKKLWQSNSSAMLINLPAQKFAPGIYIVTVTSGSESKILKLVKQ